MALTSCIDCGHDLSTLAAACTHCGRPTGATAADEMTGRERAARVVAAFMIGAAAFILVPGLAFVVLALVLGYSIWQLALHISASRTAA